MKKTEEDNITVTFSCGRVLNEWLESESNARQLPKGALVRLFLIERRDPNVVPAAVSAGKTKPSCAECAF